jgi:hypothetical protein
LNAILCPWQPTLFCQLDFLITLTAAEILHALIIQNVNPDLTPISALDADLDIKAVNNQDG